jgi:hypothetical protein
MFRPKRLMLLVLATCVLGLGAGTSIAAAEGVNEPDGCNNPSTGPLPPCLHVPGP